MSLIKHVMAQEIQKKMETASHLREEILKAKSKTKQKYFHKKLIKNNREAAKMIEALEKIDNKNKKELTNETGGTEQ